MVTWLAATASDDAAGDDDDYDDDEDHLVGNHCRYPPDAQRARRPACSFVEHGGEDNGGSHAQETW